ncbi:dihydroorotase [Chelativorans sp. YIM 93263]|uniref:dihydroorotase n=1 Tax=Chelativorans sp. YIM 93263 TaxID=2906648 RepID=UPI0023786461|nr:dihydroorotase [Chelativorans sp. YIM 93263]
MKKLTIRQPDDWHLHLRDGQVLEAVTRYSATHFARAIIMPNLVPPVVTTADAAAYRERIQASLPKGSAFTPLMTLYLTEESSADDIEAGFRDGLITAVKLYPAGATTNSQSGVRDIEAVYPILERMAEIGMPLCVHGEVTDPEIDIFDREAVFIERVLAPLRRRLPELRIVMEHVTTRDGVEFVQAQDENVGATITPHHLIINRNAILAGGIRPHYYCLPVAKRETHRLALRAAAASGSGRFFLGTDSAPHIDPLKESACGCAGVFNAPNTMACLAHVFEEDNALDRLEAFTSLNGPTFYRLPPNEKRITLVRSDSPVETETKVTAGDETITVFDPMFPIHWKVDGETS